MLMCIKVNNCNNVHIDLIEVQQLYFMKLESVTQRRLCDKGLKRSCNVFRATFLGPNGLNRVHVIMRCVLTKHLYFFPSGGSWLKWVLEYIQCFIVDSGRGEPTDHASD